MASADSKFDITIVPAPSLPSQPWWPELHTTINEAFQFKDLSVFPPTWARLVADPAKGAQGLVKELGSSGILAVAFTENNRPVACGGALPFRGENWINDFNENTSVRVAAPREASDTYSDWETCCFCVHPSARGHWLSYKILEELTIVLKAQGGRRLFTNYARDETGEFWPRLGFEVIPGAGGVLRKGFQPHAELEGLRADIHFQMGVKDL